MQRRLTSSRTGILAIILLVVMAVFVLRLFYLQIIRHGTYVAIARQNQQRSFVIPAERGKIYMMDGEKAVPVVLNQAVYTVFADPAVVKADEVDAIVSALKQIAGGEIVADLQTRLVRQGSRYEILARSITRTQAEKLKEKDFNGVGFELFSKRNYPEGQLAAQVLGFVNAEGSGQYGIEQKLENRLKGRDGLMQTVTDVRNVPLTVGKSNVRIEPKQGDNVLLTIDRNIQSYAEEALKRGVENAGASEGSVVVMNPSTGQIMALADYPTYNPGEYASVKDASVYASYATMTPFEPGSIVKTFSMATGIDQGVVTPETTYVNTDCTIVGGETMCNALKGLTGTMSMQGVLNNSLNVGMITVARRLGDGQRITLAARQTLYQYYHDRFHFGQPTGVELAEAPGVLHGPDAVGAEVNYANIVFGQGINITMLQAATAFSSVVNGGQYFRPTLIAGTVDESGVVAKEQAKPTHRTMSEQSSNTMRYMLEAARRSSFVSRSDRPGYTIGGKTGTSQALLNNRYTFDETSGTYVGFGGASSPEYVIMVRVAAPGKGLKLEGGRHAGPIFTDLSNWMLEYKKIAPKG